MTTTTHTTTDTTAGRGGRLAAPVVTGIGVTAPNGLGTEAWWQAVLRGESGIRPITRFNTDRYPAKLAGEVPGFDATEHIPGRLLPQTDHMTRLALTAADEALADAGIHPDTLPDHTTGVITAASAGGFEFGQKELQALWSKGGQYVSAYQSFAWFYAVNTGQISIKNNLRGPSGVLVTEQAGGLDAVAQARRQLRKDTRLIVTGGIDSSLCPWGWAAHLAGGELTTEHHPDRAFLPFSPHASGHVPGEGGALLVLETADSAHERGATIYGSITGHASTFDPAPSTSTGTGGSRLQAAAEAALRDAGLTPTDIDVVFADAAGRPTPDHEEAHTLTTLFGEHGIPVTAPKTMTGRLAAGGASLDLAAALLTLRDQTIPPTINTTTHHPIDLVTRTRHPQQPLRNALVLARGRGGFNAAMIVSTP